MLKDALGHPKHKKLARVCAGVVDPAHALGVCESLYLYAQRHKQNGCLVGMEPDDIADAANYGGDGGELVEAMVRVKLLDSIDGMLWIHDWEEHAPGWLKSAAQREGWKLGPRVGRTPKAMATNENRFGDSASTVPQVETGVEGGVEGGIEGGAVLKSSVVKCSGAERSVGGREDARASDFEGNHPENGDIPPGAAEGVLSDSVLRWAVAPLPRLAGRTRALDALRETLEASGETAADVRRGCELYAASDHGQGDCPFGIRRFVDECMWRDDPATWSIGKPAPDLSNVNFGED